jgi:hypothetical protein
MRNVDWIDFIKNIIPAFGFIAYPIIVVVRTFKHYCGLPKCCGTAGTSYHPQIVTQSSIKL